MKLVKKTIGAFHN